jgi:fatty-acyl-CoA synthase
MHTLNLRLHPQELAYIANHAGDRFLIVDDVLLPVFEKIREDTHFERIFVVSHGMCDVASQYENYESLLANAPEGFTCPKLHEDEAAAMCYTSGTTGKPKGVVYSHRALALHSLSSALPDHFAISRSDVVLPAMSMFHANAWGVPYAAAMVGSKQVFPGPYVDAISLLELIVGEGVTRTGAVPTVWLNVIHELEGDPDRWTLPDDLRIYVAGSAAPESLFRRFDKFGATIVQPWGMTETAPIATVSTLKPQMSHLSDDDKYEVRAKQGLPAPFIELRAVSDAGLVPWDGKSMGELQIKGPWVTGSYYNMPEETSRWTADGWFCTGDIVNIDPEGYIKIMDRQKDVIKSGGEWISSVDLENAIVAHPAVQEAAVIAVHHPKWQERPLALVVLCEGGSATPQELRALLSERFAKWQLPDDFVFVKELPHTSTGKLLKVEMRKQYADWYVNAAGAQASTGT